VFLRQNLWTSTGPYNGSIGRVVDFIYENNAQIGNAISDQQQFCVFTKFKTYIGTALYE